MTLCLFGRLSVLLWAILNWSGTTVLILLLYLSGGSLLFYEPNTLVLTLEVVLTVFLLPFVSIASWKLFVEQLPPREARP